MTRLRYPDPLEPLPTPPAPDALRPLDPHALDAERPAVARNRERKRMILLVPQSSGPASGSTREREAPGPRSVAP